MPNPAEETKQENVWEERFDRVKDIWPDEQFTEMSEWLSMQTS